MKTRVEKRGRRACELQDTYENNSRMLVPILDQTVLTTESGIKRT